MACRWGAFCLLSISIAVAITDLGQFPSLQIDPTSGNIIVVYGSASGLKISICQQEQCSTPKTMHLGCTPPLASAALTLIGGKPFIAYAIMHKSDSANLYGLACADPECSSYSTNRIGSGSNFGFGAAVIRAPNSNPMISYYDRSQNSLAIASCEDPACQSASIDYPSALGGAFYHTYGSTDIELVQDRNDTAVISFQQWTANGTHGTLQLAVCPSGSCHESVIYTIDSKAAEYSSIALDEDNNILVAYTDETYKQLHIAACTLASLSSGNGCSIKTVVTTTQMIMSPVIRALQSSWRGQPLIAYFQGFAGGSGGALYVIRCLTPQCENENLNNAVLIESSPLWVISEMQIAVTLRPGDGRPVVAYSVYEEPLSFHLKVAVCYSEDCELNRVFTIDNFKDVAHITLNFDLAFFIKIEFVLIVLAAVTIGVALYVPNKARLVNIYTLRPFTRDIVVAANCRNLIGLSLLCTFAGAALSSISWLLYSGVEEMGSLWHIFVICSVPVGSSMFAYGSVLRCSFKNLMASGVLLLASLLIFLNLTLTYTVNSYALECDTIKVPVPRDVSITGVIITTFAHLLDLFLLTRIYMALRLASPTLIASRWDEDL